MSFSQIRVVTFRLQYKMPQLTQMQRSIIATRLGDGVSVRNIANELGVNRKTVLLAKRKLEETGTISRKQGTGRQRVSSREEDVHLVEALREDPFKTAVQAKAATNFSGSVRTARRRIAETELRNRCAANKVFLTEAHMRERVIFAERYLNNPRIWQTVIFSDEKTFQSCRNGRVRVYRPVGARFNRRYINTSTRSGRFSVNVWGWISSRGPGICVIVEERLTAEVYRDILQEAMLPSVLPVHGNDFTFQQDNCPIHKARLVRQFLAENGVATLVWPARSPDLNPIENVWAIMTKKVNTNNNIPQNREELIEKIREAWQELNVEYIQKLISSMPRRIQSVIDVAGAQIKY